MNFSEMSSTTIFSIALLAVLVILLIVLVIVTIKVLSKGKKGDDEYTERRYTSRKKDKYDPDEYYDDDEDEEDDERPAYENEEEREDDYRADDYREDDNGDGEEEYDETVRESERKNDVASVVEAALQAKAKAAEFEARVAREKARAALEEAELATKRANEAEAEARAASGRDTSAVRDEEEDGYEEEEPEEYEEEQSSEEYEEESYEDDTVGTTDELRSGEPEKTEEGSDEEEESESTAASEDLMKASTRVADAANIIEAVKRARKGKRFSEEPAETPVEEPAEKPEEEPAEKAEDEPAEQPGEVSEEDSAFIDSAFAIPADSEDKKKIDTTFDSAFTDPELNREPEAPAYEDSAFGTQEPEKEEEEEAVSLQVAGETITVNPVNQVNIRTVNSTEPVNTTNEEAGIHDMAEMNDFLSENPIPKKERRKLKKKDAIFAKKFDSDAPRIRGARYLWYNNQDIEELNKKEDIYYHCHYFNDPREAVLPLVIEMYDCAFVRTEEIQKIAYGIKYQSMGLREILTAKENISFNRSKVEKDPTEQDLRKIREKWCDYVDNFLQIIEIQAPDDIQDYIKDQLYAYGEHDVDTLLFCPDPEDDED